MPASQEVTLSRGPLISLKLSSVEITDRSPDQWVAVWPKSLNRPTPHSLRLMAGEELQTKPDYQEWRQHDEQVLSLINNSLLESVMHCVASKKTAKDACMHSPKQIMELQTKFRNFQKGSNPSKTA